MEARDAQAGQAEAAGDVRFQDWEFDARFKITFFIDPSVMPSVLVDAIRRADDESPWRCPSLDGTPWSSSVVIGAVDDSSLRAICSVSASHPNTRITPPRHSAYSAYLLQLCQAIQAMNIPGLTWINWELTLESDPRGIKGQSG